MHDKIKSTLEVYPTILIGKHGCGFCESAISLLVENDISFLYLCASNESELADAVKEEYQHRTVPMIFVEKKFVGGFTELKKML